MMKLTAKVKTRIRFQKILEKGNNLIQEAIIHHIKMKIMNLDPTFNYTNTSMVLFKDMHHHYSKK